MNNTGSRKNYFTTLLRIGGVESVRGLLRNWQMFPKCPLWRVGLVNYRALVLLNAIC